MCPPIVDLRVVQRGKHEVTFDTADSSHTRGTSAIAEISQPVIGEAATGPEMVVSKSHVQG